MSVTKRQRNNTEQARHTSRDYAGHCDTNVIVNCGTECIDLYCSSNSLYACV